MIFRGPQDLELLIRSVYSYVAYRVGEGADAEDITSETFERALRYGADLTARQIGELLELRTNAVEVALHRALGRLREVLEGQESTEASSAVTLENAGA